MHFCRYVTLILHFHDQTASNVTVLDLASWPSARNLGLDNSQFKALQLALTNEFAVIQGPPGTGKTYIGLKVSGCCFLIVYVCGKKIESSLIVEPQKWTGSIGSTLRSKLYFLIMVLDSLLQRL